MSTFDWFAKSENAVERISIDPEIRVEVRTRLGDVEQAKNGIFAHLTAEEPKKLQMSVSVSDQVSVEPQPETQSAEQPLAEVIPMQRSNPSQTTPPEVLQANGELDIDAARRQVDAAA